MALIKCPECGKMVSDRAEKCPHCGFSVSGSLHCEECNYALTNTDAVCPECGHPAPWSRKCPDCGNYVLPTEEACPECGCDMELHFGKTAIASPEPEKVVVRSKSNRSNRQHYTLWLVVVLVILTAGGGVWYKAHTTAIENARIAREKFVADSIRAVQERIVEEERQEGERRKAQVSIRINQLLDKLESNVSKLGTLIWQYRNGENVLLELDAFMRVDNSVDIINEINSLSDHLSGEQKQRLNRITQQYQSLL